jgi:hypothetical protein
VSYLGFTLTPEGIKPGQNKLQAIKDAKPPTIIKMVRSFVGYVTSLEHTLKILPSLLHHFFESPVKTPDINLANFLLMPCMHLKSFNSNSPLIQSWHFLGLIVNMRS